MPHRINSERQASDAQRLGILVRARATLSLDRELAKVRQAGIQLLCWDDEDYPPI